MNDACKRIEAIENLPDLVYEGYVWMSDESSPRMISSKNEIPLTRNPFVVEGNLYCYEKNISISIRHLDNEYLILVFDLNEASTLQKENRLKLTELKYLAHRVSGKQYVLFRQAWVPEKDPNCENFEVLKPAWKAFVGFN